MEAETVAKRKAKKKKRRDRARVSPWMRSKFAIRMLLFHQDI
jgi:hypothetical protein